MIRQLDQSLDDYIGSGDETTRTILAANDGAIRDCYRTQPKRFGRIRTHGQFS
jgi:hypothetical protein